MDPLTERDRRLVELTATIVREYLFSNRADAADIPQIIASVYDSLRRCSQPAAVTDVSEAPAFTRARANRLITPEGIVSLIDGRRFVSMRRHLTAHGYTPETYRKTFGLPADFPIVHPDYARKRSEIAVSLGFGQGGQRFGVG